MQWITLIMICCGMAMNRMGMVGVSVRKTKALTVMIQAVTLIGKVRQEMENACSKCMKLIAKHKFLTHISFPLGRLAPR
jgi:hypothetical protein